MKAYIKNYGCQMNEQDSLHMRGLLSKIGYQQAEEPYEADLILFVSCSIREKAVHKVYSDLGRIRPYAEANPQMIVGLAGCVAQQEKGSLFKRFPFLKMVFGPDAIPSLPQMLQDVHESTEKGIKAPVLKTKFNSRQDFEFVNLIVDGEENRVKAFVNIQKGCDNVCSFCIVPRVRGAEVSRPSDQIIDEIKSLVELGVKEVTLLGQNVNSYGLKTSEVPFARLLKRIAHETNLKRLRFITSHPKDVGDDLIAMYRDLDILCPHFHLPVQSGSNRVLEAMRRQYTREHYLDLITRLKQVRPDITFSTDIIVGFPGETPDEFEQTLSLLNMVEYDSSFSFIYSPRPGTSAIRLDDDVSSDEKKHRLEIYQVRQKQISERKNKDLEGSIQEVLVEGWSDSGANLIGRTGTNKLVHLEGINHNTEDKKLLNVIGEIVPVRIRKGTLNALYGEISFYG